MRLPGHLARASGAAIVFVVAAVGGLLAHRNLPSVRRTLLAQVNAALATALPGRLVIQKLDSLDLDRVSGVDATISDSDRRRRPAGSRADGTHRHAGAAPLAGVHRSAGD